jgi:hypothetical protein
MSESAPFAAEPRRSRPGWLIFGLVVGGLVVLCCAAGAFLLGRSALEIGPAQRAADSYVAAVIAGDDARAAPHLCDDADTQARHESFATDVRSGKMTGHQVVSTEVSFRNLTLRATANVVLTQDSGVSVTYELPLRKEDGGWKVCAG